MPIQTRPTDSVTEDYLQLGMPYIEFAPLLTSGAYGPFRSLGVIESEEIAKAMNIVALTSTQSGRMVKLRELVQSIDLTLNLTTKQHSPDNLQLVLGSSSLTAVDAGTDTSTDEQFQLTDDGEDFLDLDHQLLDETTTVVTAAPIADEAVGTGQGTPYGETKGDFSLDFKPLVIGDVSAFTVGGVSKLGSLVTGAPTQAGEIGLFVGATADSGQLQWWTGEGPASGAAIVASYEPSHSFVRNTDYGVDPKHGRIRMFNVGDTTDALKDFQWMEITYDYTVLAHSELVPFTQFVFEGKTRIRLLTDNGINVVWVIPATSVRMTDDAYSFDDTNPALANLAIALLDNGTSAPYGTCELYGEESYQ